MRCSCITNCHPTIMDAREYSLAGARSLALQITDSIGAEQSDLEQRHVIYGS